MSDVMQQLITAFPNQLTEALEMGKKFPSKKVENEIRNIVICGLGGSGISGTIAGQIVADESAVPIVTVKDYFIPKFVNQHTLVIVSSYSGNTEETLSALKRAEGKGAEIACITSGGKLKDRAQEKNYSHIIIPSGMPPRAAFGYSFPQVFFILKAYGIIGDSFINSIEDSIDYITNNKDDILNEAEKKAEFLFEKTPILYTSSEHEGIFIRFKQQLNENAKMLCSHEVFPELCHNELVGWREQNEDLAILILRHPDDYKRTAKRIDICKGVFTKYTPHLQEIVMKGDSQLSATLNTIHLLDWVSLYLAQKREFDPVEIQVIDFLKNELAKI